MIHPACMPIDRLLAECSIERTRRGGPGGQHRNKVETAVVVTHNATGARAEASERRSQAENLERAVFRLRVKLALSERRPVGVSPSPLWIGRVASGRLSVSPKHEDFPCLLAESLDALAANDWAVADAADFLSVSASQLVKLLKLEPEALALLNAERRRQGRPSLR